MTHPGKVTVKTCINQAGNVVYPEILPNETTIKKKAVLLACMDAAKGYKYVANYNAPIEQCGRISFNLDVRKFNREINFMQKHLFIIIPAFFFSFISKYELNI